MPDFYATITETDPAIARRLIDAMETRAAQPQQRAMLRAYLSEVKFPPEARVLEIGCGSGAISRVLAGWPGVSEVVGVDPSPIFLEKAQELSAGIKNLTLEEGDGRELRFEDRCFDVGVLHTVLCHVPGPERVLAEAFRVLRPGGWLAVFDGDYATATVATGDFDPLQVCVEAGIASLCNDPWIVRRLPSLVESAGFSVVGFRSHAYTETTEPTYMLGFIDRSADILAARGRIGEDLATALKAEARRRAAAGEFFAHIAFASLIARKPM